MQDLGLAMYAPESTHNHRANLSTFSDFTEILAECDRVKLDVLAADFAHVLLADAARHESFTSRYNTSDPYDKLAADLGASEDSVVVRANIFYSDRSRTAVGPRLNL